MDVATCVGFCAAFGMLFWALYTGSGGQVFVYWDTASAILVFGGAIFTVLMTQAIDRYFAFFSIVKRSFFTRRLTVQKVIAQIVELGEIARREGVLSLENRLGKLEDEFLASGVQLLVDGTAANEIEQILTAELEALDQRHTQGKCILDLFAKYAPAFGMIGTLMGLVAMLLNMDDPKKIGPGMAVAILTTFYGAVIANMICLPLADKLSYRHEEEMLVRTVMLKGILALQAGDNPRMIQSKLAVYLPARRRSEIAQQDDRRAA
jgi:chemotaxis protein MotA